MYLDKNVCQTVCPKSVDIVTLEITYDIKLFSISVEVPSFVSRHLARRTVCAGSEDDIQYSYKRDG